MIKDQRSPFLALIIISQPALSYLQNDHSMLLRIIKNRLHEIRAIIFKLFFYKDVSIQFQLENSRRQERKIFTNEK